jgi:hypothetical protein
MTNQEVNRIHTHIHTYTHTHTHTHTHRVHIQGRGGGEVQGERMVMASGFLMAILQ